MLGKEVIYLYTYLLKKIWKIAKFWLEVYVEEMMNVLHSSENLQPFFLDILLIFGE